MEMVLVLRRIVMMVSMILVMMVMAMMTISPSGRSFLRRDLPDGEVFSSLLVSSSQRRQKI